MVYRLKAALAAGAIIIIGSAGLAATSAPAFSDQKHGKHGYHGKHHGKHHGGKHHRRYKGHGYKRLMERFDANKDKQLTQVELNDARTALLKKHDANGDGQLTLEEFQALWAEFMRKRMVRGFQHIDEDGDAAITIEEFLKPYSEAVEKMDRNGDGILNKDDRKRKHRRHGKKAQNKADKQDGGSSD